MESDAILTEADDNLVRFDHLQSGCCKYNDCKCPYFVYRKCCFKQRKPLKPKIHLWLSMTQSNFEMFLHIASNATAATAAFRSMNINNCYGRKLVSKIASHILGGFIPDTEANQIHLIALGRNDALSNPRLGDRTVHARVKTLADRFLSTRHRILFCSAIILPTDLCDVKQCITRLNEQIKLVISKDYQHCARFVDLSDELKPRGCLEMYDVEKLYFTPTGLTKQGLTNVAYKMIAAAKEAATETWLSGYL